MRRLFPACMITSSVSAFCLLILCQTGLVLTSRNYCIVVFTVPFTSKAVELPRWF